MVAAYKTALKEKETLERTISAMTSSEPAHVNTPHDETDITFNITLPASTPIKAHASADANSQFAHVDGGSTTVDQAKEIAELQSRIGVLTQSV